MLGTERPDPGSFRDADSRVFHHGDEVLRGLSANAWADFEVLSGTTFFRQLTEAGQIVGSTPVLDDTLVDVRTGEPYAGVLRHDRIPFVSYPYCWSFRMLQDAALLTLRCLSASLEEGFILKDGSAYNVQFDGAHPVFIDIGSFERLEGAEPWAGYRQFCEHFLFPLMLQAYAGADFRPWLRGSLDGIPTADMARLLRGRLRRRKGVLKHVALHARLQQRVSQRTDATAVRRDLAQAGFSTELVKANARALTKLVAGLESNSEGSTWSGYRVDNTYDAADAAAKETFVTEVCGQRHRGLVWDLGTNDGFYARIAARHADYVVAMDYDGLTIDRLYTSLRSEPGSRILPLVMDLLDPSPDRGWRSRERASLLSRGRPDLVLALALVHHMAIPGNVPLAEILDWQHSLGGELVVEFPLPDDPQVQRLLAGKKPGAHQDYRLDAFESAMTARFNVVHREELPSGRRVLFYATPS